MKERWYLQTKKADFNEISRKFNISPILARLLRNRNVIGDENIKKYLSPDIERLSSPWMFKDMDKAVDILKTIDIYKYNFKSEKDTDKKHLGFVIGDSYNYSKEVTNSNNTGVNNYAFTSLCCKAIQEQQEQIEELQIKDKQRNELIQSLIQRIEVLEKEAKK